MRKMAKDSEERAKDKECAKDTNDGKTQTLSEDVTHRLCESSFLVGTQDLLSVFDVICIFRVTT